MAEFTPRQLTSKEAAATWFGRDGVDGGACDLHGTVIEPGEACPDCSGEQDHDPASLQHPGQLGLFGGKNDA